MIGEEIIGNYTFQVEEFMPDRIKTTVTTDKNTYSSGDEVTITVNGAYLFGAPCAVTGLTDVSRSNPKYLKSKLAGLQFQRPAKAIYECQKRFAVSGAR